MHHNTYVPPLFFGTTPKQIAAQATESLHAGSPEEMRERFNIFRRRMMEEVCSFPPVRFPLPKPTSERTVGSLRAMERWLGKLLDLDDDQQIFLRFMITKATEKCGNHLIYHNYSHMLSVIMNAVVLTCLWVESDNQACHSKDPREILFSMVLAAAFHDTIIKHGSHAGDSEEQSAMFLRDTHALFLCLHPKLAVSGFCADIVETAYGTIAYTIPHARAEIRSALDKAISKNDELEMSYRLSLQMGAILADADVMDSLCLPFKNAVGITRRVKKELWEHSIDLDMTLSDFYSKVTPEGFISTPGEKIHSIFNYNKNLCIQRDLTPYS